MVTEVADRPVRPGIEEGPELLGGGIPVLGWVLEPVGPIGDVVLVPSVGGSVQLGLGVTLPAWVVLASLVLVAVDTVAVGRSLRSAD